MSLLWKSDFDFFLFETQLEKKARGRRTLLLLVAPPKKHNLSQIESETWNINDTAILLAKRLWKFLTDKRMQAGESSDKGLFNFLFPNADGWIKEEIRQV